MNPKILTQKYTHIAYYVFMYFIMLAWRDKNKQMKTLHTKYKIVIQ